MTLEEFSNQFDVVLNSNRFSPEFGDDGNLYDFQLNEYEKSIFLTEAQKQVILETYTGNNPYRESFDSTERTKRALNKLLETATIQPISNTHSNYTATYNNILELPSNLLYIVLEIGTYNTTDNNLIDKQIEILSITHSEYADIKYNPFRGVSLERILRLENGNNTVSLISKLPIKDYIIKYLKIPNPIILEDLPDDLSIEGISVKTDSTLPSIYDNEIITRAVSLALLNRTMNQSNSNNNNK